MAAVAASAVISGCVPFSDTYDPYEQKPLPGKPDNGQFASVDEECEFVARRLEARSWSTFTVTNVENQFCTTMVRKNMDRCGWTEIPLTNTVLKGYFGKDTGLQTWWGMRIPQRGVSQHGPFQGSVVGRYTILLAKHWWTGNTGQKAYAPEFKPWSWTAEFGEGGTNETFVFTGHNDGFYSWLKEHASEYPYLTSSEIQMCEDIGIARVGRPIPESNWAFIVTNHPNVFGMAAINVDCHYCVNPHFMRSSYETMSRSSEWAKILPCYASVFSSLMPVSGLWHDPHSGDSGTPLFIPVDRNGGMAIAWSSLGHDINDRLVGPPMLAVGQAFIRYVRESYGDSEDDFKTASLPSATNSLPSSSRGPFSGKFRIPRLDPGRRILH